MRYLANNDQLVERLSQSYPIRRAAQICVAAFYRTKSSPFVAEHLENFTPQRFKQLIQSFQNNLKKEIEAAKEELKRK